MSVKNNGKRPDWDHYFMGIAQSVAMRSKDKSTKVGAVIVGPGQELRSSGYNGFPRGVNDDVEERHVKPLKDLYTAHAERNAINLAARVGTATGGCSIYIASISEKGAHPPCSICAGAIINAGIIRVVCEWGEVSDAWKESVKVAFEMFREAGVRIQKIKT